MSKIYLPSSGASAWQGLLADPEKHWRAGYSARTLAQCWEAADGLPPEVARLFPPGTQLLLAIPEHKVPLPRGRDSQNDLFALLRSGDDIVAMTIEGKVGESFDRLVSEWLVDASPGKIERLGFLCALLGLDQAVISGLRYQLLHRTASAILEARRFKADRSAMIVHSFSATRQWFDDFALFAQSMGVTDVDPDRAHEVIIPGGMRLTLAWASGDPKYLAL